MWDKSKRIMPFIGAKDYQESRRFYSELGFDVCEGERYCEVKVNDELGFWLQKYYHKGWVNNSMIFLEIPDVELWQKELLAKELHLKYKYVRFTEIKTFDWGRELFMHDPSGVLWHFCELNNE
jgi:catechol 2,3-dioxygenase-like lactoylglutathione lyase family enzyme